MPPFSKERFIGIIFCLFWYSMMCTNHCHAQNVTTHIIELPKPLRGNILSITKDDDGFLWFRNSQGLWRFDGTSAQLFDMAKLKMKPNEITQLFTCFDHFLLLIDFKNKLHVYDQLTDTAYLFQLDVPQIYNLTRTKNNSLVFFNTAGQGYFFSREKLLQNGPAIAKLKGWKKDMHIFASAIDSVTNRLYLYLDNYVAYVNGDSLVTAYTFGGKTVDSAYIFANNDGFDITSRYVVINNPHGFMVYDKNTLKLLYTYYGRDIAGRLVEDDKLVFLAKKKVSAFAPPMQSPLFILEAPLFNSDFNLYGIIPSNQKGKYLAAGDMGLCELTFHQQTVDTFYNKQLLVRQFKNKSIRGICRFNNQLYVGTYSGLFLYNGNQVTRLAQHIAYSMAPQQKQTLLTGIENGDGLVVNDVVTKKLTLPFKGSHMNAIRCLYNYQGDSWGGADNGMYRFYSKNGVWYRQLWLTNKSLGAVRQLAVKDGRWYLATQNGFFVVDENKQVKKLYPQNDGGIIYAFVVTGNGFLLATHGNGIVAISNGGSILATYGLKDGLQGNFVYSLVKTGNLLVAGTSSGPSIFYNTVTGLKPIPLGDEENNGEFQQECNHGAFFDDTIGRQVILGGLQGLIFIDKDYYSQHINDKPARVVLSYIKLVGDISKPAVQDIFAYSASKITVPPNQSYISLKFACPLNFAHNEGFMRIQGVSDAWQTFNFGEEVNLINLPPGTYTLQARLGESLEERYWFTKTLVVLPAFYQTWWFKGLVLLTLVLLAGGVVYYLWQSKIKKLHAEQHLRTTIASDLHDDIGSTLNSISVYTEIVTRQLTTDTENATALLSRMGIASRDMIETMNDIVWAVNPKNDDFENVVRRMQFFAGELLGGKNILPRFALVDEAMKLKFTMQERKNIYLIYKEAVNNAYKYSGATMVTVAIKKETKHFILSITDNGNGFYINDKSKTGNGLGNMKSRAEEIGGTLLINSVLTEGTQILLRLKVE